MTTIKSYTDLQQSRKLAEILPIESADMSWVSCDNGQQKYYQAENRRIILNYEKNHWLPCWSLAALLGVIRETIGYTIYGVNNVYMFCNLGDEPWKLETKVYDNEVDACAEMIEKLHKLNLL